MNKKNVCAICALLSVVFLNSVVAMRNDFENNTRSPEEASYMLYAELDKLRLFNENLQDYCNAIKTGTFNSATYPQQRTDLLNHYDHTFVIRFSGSHLETIEIENDKLYDSAQHYNIQIRSISIPAKTISGVNTNILENISIQDLSFNQLVWLFILCEEKQFRLRMVRELKWGDILLAHTDGTLSSSHYTEIGAAIHRYATISNDVQNQVKNIFASLKDLESSDNIKYKTPAYINKLAEHEANNVWTNDMTIMNSFIQRPLVLPTLPAKSKFARKERLQKLVQKKVPRWFLRGKFSGKEIDDAMKREKMSTHTKKFMAGRYKFVGRPKAKRRSHSFEYPRKK